MRYIEKDKSITIIKEDEDTPIEIDIIEYGIKFLWALIKFIKST